jgi:hypothetical protein
MLWVASRMSVEDKSTGYDSRDVEVYTRNVNGHHVCVWREAEFCSLLSLCVIECHYWYFTISRLPNLTHNLDLWNWQIALPHTGECNGILQWLFPTEIYFPSLTFVLHSDINNTDIYSNNSGYIYFVVKKEKKKRYVHLVRGCDCTAAMLSPIFSYSDNRWSIPQAIDVKRQSVSQIVVSVRE